MKIIIWDVELEKPLTSRINKDCPKASCVLSINFSSPRIGLGKFFCFHIECFQISIHNERALLSLLPTHKVKCGWLERHSSLKWGIVFAKGYVLFEVVLTTGWKHFRRKRDFGPLFCLDLDQVRK